MIDQSMKKILSGSEELQAEHSYWLQKLEPGMPIARILSDTGELGNVKHRSIEFTLEDEVSQRMLHMSRQSLKGAYIFLLAGLQYLLYRYTREEDIVLGTPIFRQEYSEGLIKNLLFIRNKLTPDSSFKELVLQLRTVVGEVDQHQNYPFLALIDELNLATRGSFTFNLIFLLENIQHRGYVEEQASDILISCKILDGGQIQGTLEYDGGLYRETTMRGLVSNLNRFLLMALTNPEASLSSIEMITPREREEMLIAPEVNYPRGTTIKQLFEEQVQKHPTRVALQLADQTMTYQELNERANQLGRLLRGKGVTKGSIVGVLVERSFEMIISLLAIVKAGGAYLPMDRDYPLERINYMLKDSGTRFLLTDQSVQKSGEPVNVGEENGVQLDFSGEVIDVRTFCQHAGTKSPWQSKADMTGGESPVLADAQTPPQTALSLTTNLRNINTPDDLLYIIYTSGSTGQPKGVMIEHRNVVRLLINDQIQFDFTAEDTWTLFHSYCFDFSVWEMYGALLYGGKLVIVPKEIAQNPRAFLKTLRLSEVTVLNQTPTAFYNLSNQELLEESADLKVRYIIFGGEALNPLKLADWHQKYPSTRLINMYGITETTVHVTFKELKTENLQSNTSNIGQAIPTLTAYIMDQNLRLQPTGVPGELCVGGDGVARGYLNRPELSAEKFVPNPYNPAERIYRSGDLVRMLSNGEMEYLGRIDRQVKIRGYRIELGEIESRLLKYPVIKDAVVLAKGDTGEKTLVAYIVTAGIWDSKELRNHLAADLPDYMVPAFFVSLDRLPLTSNGKIDYKQLPDPMSERASEYQPPQTELEQKLATIWEDVLGLERVGIHELFSEVGGDSIKAVRVVSRINAELSIELRIEDLFIHQEIASLATLITELPRDQKSMMATGLDQLKEWQTNILKDPENQEKLPEGYEDFYPLSSIQLGMAYYTNINPTEPLYHDQFFYQLRFEPFDLAIVRKTLTMLMERHAILRTTFYLKEFGEAIQVLLKSAEPDLELIDLTDSTNLAEEIKKHLTEDVSRRFSFEKELLWRVRLFRLNDTGDYGLLFSCHHAILDGWSVASLTVEFVDMYYTLFRQNQVQLKPLKNTYKNYVALEAARKKSTDTEEFWRQTLEGYTRNKLPFNISGKKINDLTVRKIMRKALSRELLAQLKELAKREQVSVREIFFAGYAYLLSLITTDKDIVTGLVTHDRPAIEDSDKMLGCFLNTLPVRVQLKTTQNKASLIQRVKTYIEKAKPHEIFLADIAAIIGEKSHMHNPIFDTIFNYVNFHVLEEMQTQIERGQGLLPPLDTNEMTNTLFDLEVTTTFDNLLVRIKYSPNYFTAEDINTTLELYGRILEQLVDQSKDVLTPTALLSAEEKEQLVYEFNQTNTPYAKDKAMHQLFEEQVIRTPEQIAITSGGRSITYAELNSKANQLARHLLTVGVQSGERVGILMERRIEMIIGMLAILKAGGTYVPLDPRYPVPRQEYILRNSEVERVITESGFELTGFQTILMDNLNLDIYPSENLNLWKDPYGLAYIIYTSGSTGQPKGVMIEEHSAVNLIAWVNREYGVGVHDRLLFITSFCFDLSVYDIFGSLAAGATIVLARIEEIQNPTELIRLMREERITFWDSVPTTMNHLVNTLDEVEPEFTQSALRVVFMSGDWIPVALPDRVKKYFPQTQVISLGGATEGTVWSIYYPIERVEKHQVSIPYGRPIDNNYFYILDDEKNLVPQGVAGELYIGGVGVARGYANDPDRTKKSFIPNQFLAGEREMMYKTGDFGRMMVDGNIEFLGRIDHQVKIRGFRVELGEIENNLLKYPLIKETVVVARSEAGGEKYLCAYIVTTEKVQIGELKAFLSKHLPDYMIPTYFVELAELPLNTNGKVDRAKLPEVSKTIDTGTKYLPPATSTEERLAKIWYEILGSERVSVYDDFFDLGGHSLKATQLALKVEKEFGVEFPLVTVFTHPTIKAQSLQIDQAEKKGYRTLKPVGLADSYPLSSSQKRLYLLQQMNPESINYNMFGAFVITGDFDPQQFTAAINALIQRHESLRTSFHMINGVPQQRIASEVDFELTFAEVATESAVKPLLRRALKPFDLAKAPLLRVTLLKTPDQYVMAIDMHHIISDGVSLAVFTRDLMHLYKGNALAPLKLQYKDYAVWQNQFFTSNEMKKQEKYWLNQLNDLTYTELPKKAHTAGEKPKATSYELNLTLEQTEKLRQFAREQKVTNFTFLLAIFKLVLAKTINQEDITLGTPVAGRNVADLENLIGLFLNVLVLRSDVRAEEPFKDFLKRVKDMVIEAQENQDYPYEEMYAQVKKVSHWQPNSLFTILFNYLSFDQDYSATGHSIKSDQIRPYQSGNELEAHYEATLYVSEREDEINLRMVYREDLLDSAQLQGIIENMQTVLEAILMNDMLTIGEIQLSELAVVDGFSADFDAYYD